MVRRRGLRTGAALLAATLLAVAPVQAAPAAPAQLVTLPDDAAAYLPTRPPFARLPLVVLLHGSGGSPAGMIAQFRAEAERQGVVLLAPKSAGHTWDLILARRSAGSDSRAHSAVRPFTVDAARIERAMQGLQDAAPIDPARVTLGGFSDGASYALSLA